MASLFQSSRSEQEKARKRKEHKKSRGGCQFCKQKRIKCDEAKPICKNCLIRGYECIFIEHDSPAPGPSHEKTPQPSSSRSGQLAPILPAMLPNPFQSLPIVMTGWIEDLYSHYMHYRTMLRNTVPRNPSPPTFNLETAPPAWIRTKLLCAIAHRTLTEGPETYVPYSETYLEEKAEVISAIQEQIDQSQPGPPEMWCVNVVICLLLDETILGEFEAAEAHLRGVFAMLDLAESQGSDESRVYVQFQKRRILVALALLAACHYPDLRPAAHDPSLATTDITFWANAAYLFMHVADEFPFSPEGHDNAVAPLMRWLARSRSRSGPGPSRASGSSSSSGGSSSRAAQGQHGTELAECRMAVAAYALAVGSLRPVRGEAAGHNKEEAGSSSAGSSKRKSLKRFRDWMDGEVEAWRGEESPIEGSQVAVEVLENIAWLQSEGSDQEAVLNKMASVKLM